jgi:hypothetical protein
LTHNVGVKNRAVPILRDLQSRKAKGPISLANAFLIAPLVAQPVSRRYCAVVSAARTVNVAFESRKLGEQSAHVAKLFAAQQYEEIVQYWTQLYEASPAFVNFYVAVTAIRACRARREFHRASEIAQKLLDSMLSYPNVRASDFELHSATIVLAFMHAPDGQGKKRVLEMISRLSSRHLPVSIPVAVLLKDMTKSGSAHQSIAAIKLLKQLAAQYPELKRADFHLVDLLVNLSSRNQQRATQDLLGLMGEWQVEFGPNSLILLVEAGLKKKFPAQSLHDHYLPLFNDFPPERLSNDMVLAVAKLIRQQKFNDLLQLPLRMREKVCLKNGLSPGNFAANSLPLEKAPQNFFEFQGEWLEKIEREETSWVAYQMHYHLIAIACEAAEFDVAVRCYLDSLACSSGKSQDFSSLVAFFTTPYRHIGMEFAYNHIIGDSIYTYSDGTTEFIPMWNPDACFNPNNALLLLTKLIKFDMPSAAIKIIPIIYSQQDNVRWESQHIKILVQVILAHLGLASPILEQVMGSMGDLLSYPSLPPELEALIFIEVEKLLALKVSQSSPPSEL